MDERQQSLPLLPRADAMGREEFILGPCNAVAFAMLDSWPGGWASQKMALIGPEGSGKTHLAHIWTERSGGTILPARELLLADIPTLACGPLVVEDVPDIAGHRAAEETLFHLHNLILAEGHSLLVTATRPPSQWGLILPDLASRMEACPAVHLQAPDDALLGALLIKFFTDRQIMPSPDVIPYLLPRIERSFKAAARIAAALDEQSLVEKRKVTRSMAIRVLDQLEERL